MESTYEDHSVAMNHGSMVELPNSSDEDDSGDELAKAGDALCRTLMQEQKIVNSVPASPRAVNGRPEDKQPNLAEVETKSISTPSPSTSDAEELAQEQLSLEERVLELEAKLVTLSRILRQQQRLSVQNLLARSPAASQRNVLQASLRLPTIPLMEDIQMDGDNSLTDSPPHVQPSLTQKGMVPYLESPAPMMDDSPRHKRYLHQRKRLSFHLLYDGNEENFGMADDDSNGKPPLTDTNNLPQPNRTLDTGDDNDDNFTAKETTTGELEPIQCDTKANNDSRDPNSEAKSSPAGAEQTTGLGEVSAACAVDAQDKNATDAAKDTSAPHSSLDGSQNNNTKPTTPVRASSTPPQGEEQSISTSTSPVLANSGLVKRVILPPLLLSKDKRSKWLDHLNSFQESNHDVDRQMQEFIKVPGAVEKTLNSGLLICVDSFLYVWTILPIRFAWSCVLLSLHYFFKWTKKPPGNYQFHRRHMYQLIQVSILFFIYRYILLPISIGKLYHWIRGQTMLKLYVLMAMVEVFDRLMCSLGQDCLDSLYWNTTRRPRSSRMLISISVVMVYTAVHSLILFVHVACLNVAMNSADEALLALLIGGNFAEIKSTVFKKYNKPSLFKIVASDICERFKLALFLGLVLLLNFCQGMDSRKMSDYQRIAGIVWMSELLCDWLKHAFITKFNFIPSTVYPEYGLLLAGDVTGIGHEGVNLDHSHAVVKRIGFAQMPLVCVMARLVREAAKYMSLRIDSQAVPSLVLVVAGAGCWILLLSFKIFLGAYLQRSSLAKLHAAPELSQPPLKSKQKY